MKKEKFPYPKLNLPKEIRNDELFNVLDVYLDSIKEFIYTDIDLKHDPKDSNHKYAWVLKVVSANLIRSIYIRNDVVEAINTRNITALFLGLKAWFEIVGVLAAILDILEKNLDNEEFSETFICYALGNKGKGKLRVGEIEGKSVMAMIEKADKYDQKISKRVGKESKTKTFFTDFYDVASNPSHPSFEAYELVGGLVEGGVWKAKEPGEVRDLIVEYLPVYGGLLAGPRYIFSICREIFEGREEYFGQIKAKIFFD